MKLVTDLLLAILVAIFMGIFMLMPRRLASDAGGFLARNIGSRIALSRKIRRNLQYIYPNMPQSQQDQIISGVWDNLGRNFAEFPHLSRLRFDGTDVLVEGVEDAEKIMKARPVILVTAHLGNWEVIPYFMAARGWNVAPMYRRANNRFVDAIIQFFRARTGLQFMPKGKSGSKMIIENLQSRRSVALLMDQRMSDGEEILFLGKPAMTATGWLRLVQKYDCAIVPFYCIRQKNGTLKLVIQPPILPELLNLPEDNRKAVLVMAKIINEMYGQWIADHLGQWLWLHRRWGRV